MKALMAERGLLVLGKALMRVDSPRWLKIGHHCHHVFIGEGQHCRVGNVDGREQVLVLLRNGGESVFRHRLRIGWT